MDVTIIGGGLAGSEIALQLASRGIPVELVEMRPEQGTPAHQTGALAELVCSNSLKSERPETASGLFKRELALLGCRLLEIACGARVPAGHALAVDRELFSRAVTEAVESEPLIRLERREQIDLDLPGCSVVATGPLTSESLSKSLREHFGAENLHFYDAISISIDADSVDHSRLYRASRYGKGGADYWNVPFSKDEYERLVEYLRAAPCAEKRGFEKSRCFEACLPVEVIASSGAESLRFGPLKPKGLADPETGREPHAVLQLRQETRDGGLLGLVGFQTRLTRPAQRKLPRPQQHNIGIGHVRWGSIHRNTFIDAPRLLDEGQMSRNRRGLFFSGQIVGVEGYVESIAHGLVTALNVERYLHGEGFVRFPRETLIGALQEHLTGESRSYQPMNVNFGIVPPVDGPRKRRKELYARRSIETLERFLST